MPAWLDQSMLNAKVLTLLIEKAMPIGLALTNHGEANDKGSTIVREHGSNREESFLFRTLRERPDVLCILT